MSSLHFSFLRGLALLAVSAQALHAETATPADLNRYTGTYELIAGRKLRVYRDGDQLKAQADGQLAATLKSEPKSGRFSVVEVPLVLQFQEDKAGVVTAVEIAAPNGVKKRFPRLVDRHDTIAAAVLHAFDVDAETSVNARVFNGYTRTPDLHGGYTTETYALGNGGFIDKSVTADASIDGKTFKDIVQIVAPSLARQGYLPGADPAKTDLLVMVYWGATAGKHISVVSQRQRDLINAENARLLGYEAAMVANSQREGGIALFSTHAKDLMEELEERRYWVALCAFDFQTARKDKKLKLLWTIRYNLPSDGTNFTAALPQMTDIASRYFGRDSGGLINRPSQDKTGRVELGETKVLGTEQAK